MKLTIRKSLLAFFLVILLVGAGIALFQLQRQQQIRGKASTFHWASFSSASASCSSSGTVHIDVSFNNQEKSKSMNVTAVDKQSGESTDLGTVGPGDTATGSIDTLLTNIASGTVDFNLSWTDATDQKDTVSSTYTAVDSCQQNACSDVTKSACLWDSLEGANKYNVTVTDTTSGDIIVNQTVDAPQTELDFSSEAGKTYQCTVSAVNECGTGEDAKSKPMTCPLPSPTPTPTSGVCQETESTCSWDSLPEAGAYDVEIVNSDTGETVKSGTVPAPTTDFSFPSEPGVTYVCKVTAVNECGKGKTKNSQPIVCSLPSPTPTWTPTPTDTPTPTNTPTPSPTASITPSPKPTLTPNPTYTPMPTQTPYPTATPQPTATPYPTYTPVPTLTPVVIVKIQPTLPPEIVAQKKYYPTMAATGDASTTIAVAGIGLLLTIIGGIVFFAL